MILTITRCTPFNFTATLNIGWSEQGILLIPNNGAEYCMSIKFNVLSKRLYVLKGGGESPLKISKTRFRDSGWANFLSGSEPPDHYPAKSGPKNQIWKISIITWIDNSLLSSHKNMGMRNFFGHYLTAKLWNSSVKNFFENPKSKLSAKLSSSLILKISWKNIEKPRRSSVLSERILRKNTNRDI